MRRMGQGAAPYSEMTTGLGGLAKKTAAMANKLVTVKMIKAIR